MKWIVKQTKSKGYEFTFDIVKGKAVIGQAHYIPKMLRQGYGIRLNDSKFLLQYMPAADARAYMVTNGKAVDKMADLAMASLEWWAYCDEKDDYMCGLCISSDNFHEVIPYESKSILSGLKYNRNDKVTDFHLAYLLNEGRAKNLDSNIYKKREPHVDKLEYEFNKTGDIDFYSGELYLNAIGDVVSGCDWSYKSQKKYRFGNVMNKNWLENISNSELYIAS